MPARGFAGAGLPLVQRPAAHHVGIEGQLLSVLPARHDQPLHHGRITVAAFGHPVQDVEAAVQGAATAFRETKAMPAYRRIEVLGRVVLGLKAEQEAAAESAQESDISAL